MTRARLTPITRVTPQLKTLAARKGFEILRTAKATYAVTKLGDTEDLLMKNGYQPTFHGVLAWLSGPDHLSKKAIELLSAPGYFDRARDRSQHPYLQPAKGGDSS